MSRLQEIETVIRKLNSADGAVDQAIDVLTKNWDALTPSVRLAIITLHKAAVTSAEARAELEKYGHR